MRGQRRIQRRCDAKNGEFEIKPRDPGHEVFGYEYELAHTAVNGDTRSFSLRQIPSGTFQQLIWPSADPSYAWWGGHISWANARPDSLTPALVGLYTEAGDETKPWTYWRDEVLAVRTDGIKSEVFRIRHHRSRYPNTNNPNGYLYNAPRVSASLDRRFVLFTPNMEDSLPNERREVYMAILTPEPSTDDEILAGSQYAMSVETGKTRVRTSKDSWETRPLSS